MFLLYQRNPFILNIVIGPVIAYVAMTMNVIVFYISSAKDFINMATILMRALAVSDGLTAFCTYGLEPMFNQFYTPLKNDNITEKTFIDELLNLRYPYCFLHYMTSQLADTFHLTSIFVTSCLGLQKMVAVIFPIWSRVNMTNRKGYCLTLLCYLLPISISLPKLCFINVSSQTDDKCISINNKAIQSYILKYYPMLVSVILVVLSISMIISTTIIIAVLLNRNSIRGRNSMSDKEKKSCCLVVIVIVVFLATEIPRTYLNVSLFGEYSQDTNNDIVLKKIENNMIKDNTMCFENVDGYANFQYVHNPDHHNRMKKLLNFKRALFRDINSALFRDINYWHSLKNVTSRFVKAFFKRHTSFFVGRKRRDSELITTIINMFDDYFYCLDQYVSNYQRKLTYIYLAIFPYNEQMNYMINVSANNWNMELKELKIVIEILKITTLVGCVSNFLIYVMMSEKIKERIEQKFCHSPF